MREAFHLSPQQRRAWRRGGGGVARARFRLPPEVTSADLRRAAERLVERHEILRTTFVRPTGAPLPFQEIHPPGKGAVAWVEAPGSGGGKEFDPEELPGLVLEVEATGDAASGSLLTLTTSPLRLDREGAGLLVEELLHLVAGREAELEEEPFQYADYSDWRNEEDDAAAEGRSEAAPEPAPRLPWEPPRQGRGDDEMAVDGVVERKLGTAAAAALAGAVAEWGASPRAVLLAAWAALLRRHAAGDYPLEVLLGGRDLEELAGAVGPYAEWRRLPNDRLAATDGRRLAEDLDTLLSDPQTLPPGGDDAAGGGAGFAWRETATVDHPASLRPIDDRGFTAGAPPLTLEARAVGDEPPTLRLLHLTDRLAGAEAGRLLDRLEAALVELASGDRPLDRLSLVTAGDRTGRASANVAAPPAGSAEPVHLRFAAVAAERPDATALVFEDEVLSYGELARRARLLAARLRDAGVGPEVPVPLAMERSAEAVVALLAVLSAGGAFVPLDLAQPVDRLLRLTHQLGSPVVLTHGEAKATAGGLGLPVIDLDDLPWQDEAADELIPQTVDGAQLAYLIFTSGSTGDPKPVAVEHRHLAAYVAAVSQALELADCASFASLSTLAADLGYTAVFPALTSGAALQLVSHRRSADPQALAEQWRRHPVDCLKVVPGHLAALASGDEAAELMPARRLVLGGEALTRAHLATFRDSLPESCRVFNHYGPTETTVGVVTLEVGEPGQSDGVDPRAATIPIGRPLPGTAVHLLDAGSVPVADWLPGEVHVAGPQVSRGYLGRPAATAERFVPDPFADTQATAGGRLYRTGDLARRLPGGEIEFLGRADGQVKVRGFRVELGEVEAALADHPQVAEAAVTTDGGEAPRLLAYFTPRDGAAPSADDLSASLARRLPAYMLPASYTRLAGLPRTANGKVDRRALPAPVATAAEDRPYTPPSTPAEEALCRIWAQVLGVERVGAGDNFFELGGDSILSIQVIARAGEAGYRLQPMDVFEHQTVAELARVARHQALDDAPAAEPLTGPVPLTPIQHRFFAQDLAEPHHWNQAVLLEVAEEVPAAALEATLGVGLEALLRHHDALRLRYRRQDDGTWAQSYVSLQEAAAGAVGETGLHVDLSSLPAERAEQAMGERARQLQSSLDLAAGPLFRVALFDLGAAGRRLFLVAHHLLVDGVSWRVLVDDLQRTLEHFGGAGTPKTDEAVPLPPKTASFRDHAEEAVERAASEAVTSEAGYWLSEERQAVVPLTTDGDAPSTATEGDAGRLRLELPTETTRSLLQEAPAAYRASIEELMLTAFATAARRELGRDVLLVDVERHGRDGGGRGGGGDGNGAGLDLSRTVGWFTVVFPLLLRAGDGSMGERVARVKDALRSVPGRGDGHGLLRHLSPDADLRRRLAEAPAAQARFNYLGQAGAAVAEGSSLRLARGAEDLLGAARAASTPLSHALGADALVVDGRLRCDWTWAPDRLSDATARAVADAFFAALGEIVEARDDATGAEVPSDFPLASLSAEELEAVGGLLEEVDSQ